jgi:hypothetical protein
MDRDPLELLEGPLVARVAERFVCEAQVAAGVPAALYVADLDARSLRRVAADDALPDELETTGLARLVALRRRCPRAGPLFPSMMQFAPPRAPQRRRGGGDLADAAAHIHQAICALEVQEIFMSAVLAAWDAPSSCSSPPGCSSAPPRATSPSARTGCAARWTRWRRRRPPRRPSR